MAKQTKTNNNKKEPIQSEQKRTKEAKKAVLLALEGTLGVITKACQIADVSRTQFYKWVKDDSDFAEAVEEMSEIALDFVESKLFEKISGVEMVKYDKHGVPIVYTQAPDTIACIFYLKTRGKERGYVERQEIVRKDVEVDFTD